MGKLIHRHATELPATRALLAAAAALLASVSAATAQSAENFDTARLGGQADAAEEIPAVDGTPSRFAAQDLANYIKARAAVLSMRDRETDPFGYVQDPEAKPVEKKPVVAAAAAPVAEPSVPFSEIVRQISIQAVMPKERQFLVGTRVISLGDKFPIHFRGKNIPIEVIGVTSRAVTFRNLESDETAASTLDLLPLGMTKGQDNRMAPGMRASGDSAPLQIGN